MIRTSAMLVAAGMTVELLSLIRVHPFSFLAFACIGLLLVAAGVGLYLFEILIRRTEVP